MTNDSSLRRYKSIINEIQVIKDTFKYNPGDQQTTTNIPAGLSST